MKTRSIRENLHLLSLAVLGITGIIFINAYLDQMIHSANIRSQDVLKIEKGLSDIISMEMTVLTRPSEHQKLENMYLNLMGDIRGIKQTSSLTLLEIRRDAFDALLKTKQEGRRSFNEVDLILHQLLESVRYIHEHHIAYMKNLLNRGLLFQDYDPGEGFARSPIKSASEVDIIEAAVSIQTSLLDLLQGFYDLREEKYSPPDKAFFSKRIGEFYNSVNAFEDFSLDAQDGILVEELLINGRLLEDAFTRLRIIERISSQLESRLLENRKDLLGDFRKTLNRINKEINGTKKKIRVLQVIALLISLGLIILLFFYGKKMVQQFRRTEEEATRIRNDLSYRIPLREDDFSELLSVFDSMNAMSNTIEKQVHQLEAAQRDLSERVKERTSELIEANKRLQKEVTERIQSEKIRLELESNLARARKMEAIGTLAGGVAHDLNNILSGIITYPDLILMDMPDDHPLRSSILAIRASGKKAAAIVSDLLTLARRGIKVQEEVTLRDVVDNYLASPEFKFLMERYPDIQVKTKFNEITSRILGSSVHLSKTIMNLATNAVEAMPNGGILEIKIDTRNIDNTIKGYENIEKGKYVILTVSDTGQGIAAEDIERIFEPFYTKKHMGRSGTGLGMAVVWGTIKDHGGAIDVKSTLGQGTVFTLYFPLLSETQYLGIKEKEKEIPKGRGESVLVVDDAAEQREIAEGILNRLGYQACSASSGKEALKILQSRSMDLVLLDMIMEPEMDGLETYTRILEIHPGQKAIIVSGFSDTERVKATQRLGAGKYLKKPYDVGQIGRAIRAELDR